MSARLAAALSYPLLVHLSVLLHRPALAAAGVAGLGGALLWAPLSRFGVGAWTGFAALVAGALALAAHDALAPLLAYAPPLLLALALWAFASSLRAGQTPLVTRFAAAAHEGALPDAARGYTRAVTWLWTFALALSLLTALLLAQFAAPRAASWFGNAISPMLLCVLFAAEYAVRRWRFRGENLPPLSRELKLIARGLRRA